MQQYKLPDIIEITGLKTDFINKCLKHLKDHIDPHTVRSDNNSRLFNHEALRIFERIKQWKDAGLNIAEIKKRLDAPSPDPSSAQGADGTSAEPRTASDAHEIAALLENSLQEIKVGAEKSIHGIESIKESLKNIGSTAQIPEALDLPPGITPELIRQDWEEREQRRTELDQLVKKLKTTHPFRYDKKKVLIQRMKELVLRAWEKEES